MKKFAPILIILAGCFWGTLGLFVRKLTDMGLDSLDIGAIRNSFTAVILFLIVGLRDRKSMKIKLKSIPWLAAAGIFSVVLMNYFYFTAVTLMDMSIASILLYTSPIFVMLMSALFFRERITSKKVVALILAFLGCVLVSGITGGTVINVKGVVFGIASGFVYALYSIFSRVTIKQGVSGIAVSTYTFLFAAIGGIALSDVGNIFRVIAENGPWAIAFMALYAFTATVIPYVFYTIGLTYVENGVAAVIVAIEPVVATILGAIVYKEVPSLSAAIGIILVLSAIILLNIRKSDNEIS